MRRPATSSQAAKGLVNLVKTLAATLKYESVSETS
jgi:hypothetical protein